MIYNSLSLSEGVKISVGSYTGTGGYGSSSPNSLTFDFEPKYVYITARTSASSSTVYSGELTLTGTGFIARRAGETWVGSDRAYTSISNNYLVPINCTAFGETVTWYSQYDNYSQCNVSGTTYYYFAIG